ncbi:PREDICTED: dermokine isoform X1 [Capra hircus]|uniref:dermokine isoform X1 n=1 Tax=Capra hircus TaxID=9925 RepID=UPI000846AF96|nr:PREDICTED: dermokine isoform X1 [Capra hircus]
MKRKGSLACLLLFLLLGSGEASPMQSGETDAAGKVGEAIVHGVGEGVGEALGEAAIQGIEKAIGQGTGEKASLGIREARDPHLGDALAHKLKEASHALKNTGSEAGRQAENIIGHGVDPAHSSWQGVPGSNGAWGTNGQPPSGHHGIPGSQGSSGGPGDTHEHVFSGGSGGSFGANAQGGSWGQGGHRGPFNPGANSQGTAPQPGSVRSSSNGNTECTTPPGSGGSSGNSGGSSSSGSSSNGGGSNGGAGSNGGPGSNSGGSSSSGSSWDTRNSDHGGSSQGYNPNSSSGSRVGSGGRNKPECDNPHVSGGSGGQGQGSGGEGEAVSGINTLNSQTSSEPFNFDTFWKNFKSKLGFINWDALNKGQAPPPSTRALLYFRRLWQDFKHNTPFLNWKVITEGEDVPSLQKRAGGAGQPGTGWQDTVAGTAKNYNYNQQGPPTALGGQYPVKTPAKGGVTVSSSASQTHPSLLQWVKFW